MFYVMLLTCFLAAGNAPAIDAGNRLLGTWGETALMLNIESVDDVYISGDIVQTWVNAAGQRRSGHAKFVGIKKGPDLQIFLFPSRFVTLPFVFQAHRDIGGLTLINSTKDNAWTVTRLKYANQAIYRSMLADLPSVQVMPPLVWAPLQSIEGHKSLNAPINGEGCQCAAEKKSRVAAETADFATRVDSSIAELNDYVGAMQASQIETNARARALKSPPEGYVFGKTFQNVALLAAQSRLKRLSVKAFDNIFRDRREKETARINGLRASCKKRDLHPNEAMTAEAKLWVQSCDRVSRAARFLLSGSE